MNRNDWDRVVASYDTAIASPFSPGVKNPLYAELRKIPNKKKKTILDLGCGRGVLLPFLAQQFKTVHALDFSPTMIRAAKRKGAGFSNIEYHVQDMCDLHPLHDSCDGVVAVNSILNPSLEDCQTIFAETAAVLKRGGIFLGIFPAIDSDIYRAMLTYERSLLRNKKLPTRRRATIAHRATATKIGAKTYDFLLGIFDNEGKQKHYYQFELEFRLRRAGFKQIRLSKVLYPWNLCEDPDRDYLREHPPLWDWFVVART